MNIKLDLARKEDYIKADSLLVSLHNEHAKNYPEYYKFLDSFNSEEEYIDLINQETNIIILAKESDNILGLIWAEKREKPENKYMKHRKELWLEAIVVDDAYKNRGLGKILLDGLIEIYEDEAFDSIELMCWSKNEQALKFYEKYFKDRALIMTYSK